MAWESGGVNMTEENQARSPPSVPRWHVSLTAEFPSARMHGPGTTVLYTCMAMVAFAANSILCRVALREGAIDPASFSTIRFAAGAVTLCLVSRHGGRSLLPVKGSWTAAAILTLYALPFAYAYTRLGAGTGALLLFGSVQVTMLVAALASGERPRTQQWIGWTLSLGGLIYLVAPGVTAPSPSAALSMAIAGICWGLYSLGGRGVRDPLPTTTGNFLRSAPLIAVASAALWPGLQMQTRGVIYAVISGSIASGLGYVVWYSALRRLSSVRAAIVQLSVPMLAAAGGVLFLSEAMSLRLALSMVLVLGGILLATVQR